ncbi:MAG: sulfatase-like hydrolase/transferase [Phycisphaeraceae bacterium]|nr:sulfatase-like hydrolase/transferase [Phycisphaeraceae bacterium]
MAGPNILLFLTDDHGPWSLGCYGNSECRSPTLDRLAAEGVRFANAFTPCPVCSPARACLLTGRTPSQVGIHDWLWEVDPQIGDRDWLAEEITLPQLLQQAGYYCGLSGKWHLGQSHKTPRGFDWCFGLPRRQGKHIQEYTYHLNNEPVTLTGNKTGFITDYALRFLEQAPADRPFFLNVGYIATHSPYGEHEPDLMASYAGASFRDIPVYEPHPWHKNEGMINGDQFSPHDLRRLYAGYYAAVTDMDRHMRRIFDALGRQGRLDDTLVIYTADHGCALGHQGFWGKGNSTRPLNMYEVSLRVPLLMRWPGRIPAGKVVADGVDHYDHFKAICAVAGVDLERAHLAERRYPGRSLWPLACGQTIADWRQTRFGEYGDLRMIRTPGHKLVRRYGHRPDELFDLRQDPLEKNNLAAQPTAADLRATMEAELEEFYAKHDDPRHSGLRVKELPKQNDAAEAWRDGLREARFP